MKIRRVPTMSIYGCGPATMPPAGTGPELMVTESRREEARKELAWYLGKHPDDPLGH